ncbi:MAG TPA: hypothetical protein VN843_04450, partial [Anaerolineales bacterium]|nr:hypothetical protein [Anaerolineales bacterium]
WENAPVEPVTNGVFFYTNGIPNWPEPRHFAPFVDLPAETSFAQGRHTVWLTRGGLTRTLEVCNLQPVKASVDLYTQGKRKEWGVESGVIIEPGFCKSFERTFHRIAPAFWVQAAVRGKVIKWYLGEEVVLEGGDDALSVCLSEDSKNVVFHDEPKATDCNAGESAKSFVHIPDSFSESTSVTFNLTLPEELIPLPKKGNEIDLEKAKIKVRHLAAWWPRRMEYLEKFGDKEPLFTVGPSFNDASPNALGVTVAQALDVSPLGTPVSLKKNMVVVEAFGQPIYSPIDFEILMVEFGNSKTHGGVLNTFPFKAWNGDVLEAHEGVIFFNPAAWPMIEAE